MPSWKNKPSVPIALLKPTFWLLWFLWLPGGAAGQSYGLLSKGAWYKFGVTKPGIYQIDDAFCKQAGIDLSSVAPDRIALYSHGAGVLPQANSVPRPGELQPVAIQVDTRSDGKAERIFFYGEGPTAVFFDEASGRFTHEINPYTDTTFYFLTIQDTPARRIENQRPPTGSAGPATATFDHYWYYEKEATNLLKSGRSWWGDYLGTTTTLNFELPFAGLVNGETATLSFAAIATAQTPTRFVWQVDGHPVGEQSAGTVSTYRYDLKAQIAKATFRFAVAAAAEKLGVNLSFEKNGQTSATAYLDYVSLQVKRRLKPYAEPTFYRFPPDAPTLLEFSDVDEQFLLWNVTDPLKPERILLDKPNGATAWTAALNPDDAATLIGFKKSQATDPHPAVKIANQDIRAHACPDMLIVTAPGWQDEAERLAAFREANDGLKVLTFTTEQIFHEFSAGKPDVSAIRDFCRYFYRLDPQKLKYLLLFGDATFDFRNKRDTDSPAQRANWVPTYQSRESLHPVYTFASDDYFGFLDDASGQWNEDAAGDHLLQIGVGRLPVKSKAEARLVTDKLIDYATNSAMGKWRNRIAFVADNGDQNIHQQHADQLASLIGDQFITKRIFIDEYPLISTSLGHRAPAVNREIHRNINEGSLVFNFTGHGDESGWTDEQILTIADMQSLRGYRTMPLLVTATCEFGRYDDPGVVSGAELMMLSPRGAAIGAMTTTRPVFSSTNFAINSAFYSALSSGLTTLGDIIRVTKNKSLAGALNRNFVLIGDPAMKLAVPELAVRILPPPDTLRPKTMATLKGEIVLPDTETIDREFDGIAYVSVYDQPTPFTTRGAVAPAASYKEYRTRLFEGKVTVTGGRFEVNFMVPDEGLSHYRLGMISVYAHTLDELADASGHSPLPITGTGQPLDDLRPPEVRAYLNEASFEDGQTVAPNPTLHVTITDESGLTLSSGIGSCGLYAMLDDTLALPVVDYISTTIDSYQEAEITMPLQLETEGSHTLTLRFCDVNGNSTEKTIRFAIKKEAGIVIGSVVAYPNPFREKLSFRIAHNRQGHDLEVQIRLFSKPGRRVYQTQFVEYSALETIEHSVDPFGTLPQTKPEPEIYLYELTLRSLQDMTTRRVSGKVIQR